jgi:acyl-coenzyme A thioesterase PaaI-like protein
MTTTRDHATFFRELTAGPWAVPSDPGHRVGAALGRLAAHALAGAPGDASLEDLAAKLEAILPPDAPVSSASRYRDDDRPRQDDPQSLRPNGNGTHPIIGPRNPVAPPVRLRLGDGVVYGDVVYDVRFEGLPGLVQGGFIALAFDIMIGQGIAMSGPGGMTGSLSVRFLAPTPLYQPLVYEGRFDRREGRKVFGAATLRKVADGTLCAEAEGVFIRPREAAEGR